MSRQSATQIPYRPCALWVLSDEQRAEFAPELDGMRNPAVEFEFESSASEALTLVGRMQPAVVVVGTTVGMMDGLEFLALVSSRQPDFGGRIVVLPELDDDLVPMCHYKDSATGRSITEEISIEGLREVFAELGRSAGPSGLAPVEAPPSPVAAAVPLVPVPTAANADLHAVAQAMPVDSLPTRGGRGRIIAVVVAGVVAVGVLAVVTSGGEDEPAEPEPAAKSAAAKAPTAKAKSPEQRVGEAAPAKPVEPDRGSVADDRTGEAPTIVEDGGIDPTEPAVLPLLFSAGGSGYRIEDPRALDRILKAFGAALEADPGVRLEVGGHTSRDGGISLNRAVGQERADAVRRDLISRGIPEDRIVIKSYGESQVLHQGPDAKEMNRRVTIQIVDASE